MRVTWKEQLSVTNELDSKRFKDVECSLLVRKESEHYMEGILIGRIGAMEIQIIPYISVSIINFETRNI